MGFRHRAADLIRRKRAGQELPRSEMRWLVRGFASGEIPDFQMAAWLMAACCRGMSRQETRGLMHALLESGQCLDLAGVADMIGDKHSTGGVGDKVTLVLAPVVAACGLPFAKLSGRALGHTGGTIDKLESIPGFRTDLTPLEIRRVLEQVGVCVTAQTPNLVPADGLLYALRDATATVDQEGLIAASIMAKKIAGGAQAVVLDVKVGEGSFFQRLDTAEQVARLMAGLGEEAGLRVGCVLTAMDAPLGRAIGNALEVKEAMDTLRGEGPEALQRVVLALAGRLLFLAERVGGPAAGEDRARRAVESGAALATCRAWIEAQGGSVDVTEGRGLPEAAVRMPVVAESAGWVSRISALSLARVCLALGAGRETGGAIIDHAVGVTIEASQGQAVQAGDTLAWIHARTEADALGVEATVRGAFRLEAVAPRPEPLILKEL